MSDLIEKPVAAGGEKNWIFGRKVGWYHGAALGPGSSCVEERAPAPWRVVMVSWEPKSPSDDERYRPQPQSSRQRSAINLPLEYHIPRNSL